MRKPKVTIACIILSFLILCLAGGAAAAEQTTGDPAEAMAAYRDVLLGSRGYLRCSLYDGSAEETFMTDEITSWYEYLFDPALGFSSFAVTDLDADGSPELLLALSNDFGYELLRYEDGQVYGFSFVARAMEAVTTDGDIHGSNGAGNFGWYRVSFSGAVMETALLCWMNDEETEAFQYFIGDAEATQSEFAAMNDALWGAETISFTSYSPENIGEIVSGY